MTSNKKNRPNPPPSWFPVRTATVKWSFLEGVFQKLSFCVCVWTKGQKNILARVDKALECPLKTHSSRCRVQPDNLWGAHTSSCCASARSKSRLGSLLQVSWFSSIHFIHRLHPSNDVIAYHLHIPFILYFAVVCLLAFLKEQLCPVEPIIGLDDSRLTFAATHPLFFSKL